MAALQRTQESQAEPLLTPADVERPLEYGELVDAASILTQAGQDPDDTAQEAVGYYRRKEMLRLMGNATFDASRLAERLEKLETRLPREIEESDLLMTLVRDLAQARDKPTGKSQLPDLFGIRARKQKRERLEALREKAAIDEMLHVTDLHIGDDVQLSSSLPRNWGKASSVLKGVVIGSENSDIGPSILLRVKQEKRSGKLQFKDLPRRKGAVVRLAGTVLWGNGYRKDPSYLAQNETLEFIDKDGRTFTHSDVLVESNGPLASYNNELRLGLDQMSINGTDIFTKT
jgi:hypothetical protein